MIKVSVCIVNYNSGDTIIKALDSLYEHIKGVEMQIYVSDNASTDNSVSLIEAKYPNIAIMQNDNNLGFSAGNNIVLDFLDSDYHVLVNPDITVSYDVISQMADYMENHPDIGILTPKILNSDGTVQNLPKRNPKLIYLLSGRLKFLKKQRDYFTMANENITEPMPIDFCTGCFMFLRTSVFRKVKGFDERYFLYLEDADLTRKIKTIAKTIYHPDFFVYHEWQRASHKSVKFLFTHINSMFKYFLKWFGAKD